MIFISELTKTCFACPAQWEGKTTRGEDIYIRYRWGWLRLDINNETALSERVGDEFDGFLDIDKLRTILRKHLIFIEMETYKEL